MAKVQSSILDRRILGPAVGGAIRKLDPRQMARNPVMFVVEVGAVFATVTAFSNSSAFGWWIVV